MLLPRFLRTGYTAMPNTQAATKYQIISQFYSEQIASGKLQDGQQLPTEEALCNLFGVSRATVRKALDDLAYQGYILKKHSKGSFVRAGVASMCLDSLQSFTEEMARRGLSVSSRLMRVTLENAGPLAAAKLDIAEHSKVYVVERLRLVEGEPMAIEKVLLPYFYCPDLSRHDLSSSLYRLLEKEYGLRLARANQILEAALASKREAELLSIVPKSSVLKIERTSCLANNRPLEYAISSYRGDKYKFYVTMNK